MSGPAGPPSSGASEAQTDEEQIFTERSAELAERLSAALGPWIARLIALRLDQWVAAGGSVPERSSVERCTHAAVEGVRAAEAVEIRELLGRDIDHQRTSPLHVVRAAVRHATTALHELGVPAVERDPDSERLFPADDHDLTPGAFADIDPALEELGMAWGAAKAMVHRRRHLQPGRT